MAKILIVEDDKEVKQSLIDWLTLEKHLIESVESGADALQLLTNFSYELIILDWGLPDMSGPTVLKSYRAAGGQSPVIFLTGRSDLQSKTEGLDLGADDYLTKPFELSELSARIRSRLRRPGGFQTSLITIGDVVLNSETRGVQVKDENVHLTTKEFLILEYLMRHPNQTFGARVLRDALWPSDSEVVEDAVRVCMKKLRKKITINDECIVKTVLGSGYIVETL